MKKIRNLEGKQIYLEIINFPGFIKFVKKRKERRVLVFGGNSLSVLGGKFTCNQFQHSYNYFSH